MTSSHFPDPPDISADELMERIASESATFEADVRQMWEAHKSALFRATAIEGDPVFVVATSGSLVLFFDDSEDEFAVGHLGEDGRISDIGLYGDLADAVRGLSHTAMSRRGRDVVPDA